MTSFAQKVAFFIASLGIAFCSEHEHRPVVISHQVEYPILAAIPSNLKEVGELEFREAVDWLAALPIIIADYRSPGGYVVRAFHYG